MCALKSIAFTTLGCRLNQSETAVIKNTFNEKKYRIVDIKKPADMVVINTCTVTENGDADTRRLVNKVNRLNPNVQIALIGCQAQIQKEKLKSLKNVHWIVGNARKMALAEILKENENTPSSETQVIVPTIDRKNFTLPAAGINTKLTRANIKIQDGCDFFCSFCEIPYARGRARSREFDDILIEANTLVEAGHQEIVITGINVGTYHYEGKSLLNVIKALEALKGLARIRISSIEPTTMDESLLHYMHQSNKLCRYLHIPLQSGNDTILKSMQRKYTLKDFDAFVHLARSTVENICIGTDVIVGYPGETHTLFEDTYNYLRDAPIDYFHVFSYSKRTMTRSQPLDNIVNTKTIQERSRRLRELSARKRVLFYQSLQGQTLPVLFEQKKDDQWTGFTDNYAKVHVLSQQSLRNKIKLVKIAKEHNKALTGHLN